MKKKILVIYETAGGGHQAAAKAIDGAVASMYPGEFDVVLMPVRAATDSQRVSHLMDVYNHLLKIKPSYSNMGMRVMNNLNVEKVVVPLMPKVLKNLEKTFRDVKPDMIISVFGVINYSAVEILKKMGWHGKVPYIIWCTDLTRYFLRNWAVPDADMTLALRPEAKEQLIEYGVPAEKIHVLSGLPVNKKFYDKHSKFEARQDLGLDPTKFTVLISMGGVAVGATFVFTRQLAQSGLPLQVIAVCGRNERLKDRMDRLASKVDIPVKVFGFTDQMPLLMDASDIVIGKPGPGTIAEAIAKELPMLIDATHEPMSQEKGNLEMVMRQQLGIKIEKHAPVHEGVRKLMENQELYQKIQENLRRAKNDKAIEELIDVVLTKMPGWQKPLDAPSGPSEVVGTP